MYAEIDQIDQDSAAFAKPQYLGDPQSGTFDMGNGVSTAQLQNPNVSIAEHAPTIASGSPWSQSLGIFAGVVLVLVLLRFIVEIKGERKEEFSAVRIGLENWLYIFLMASTSFYAARVGVNAWSGAPGALKQFVGAI